MRVFICADMEGVAGVVARRQTDEYDTPDYARARELFEDDVLCVVHAAMEAGADEVVVADSHGPATNIDPRRFPAETRLVQGWPRPLNMMQGIEQGQYAAAMLIGHHTAITTVEGNFPHSFSSGQYRAVRINGQPISEGQLNVWIAGHYGVPVVAASGDDACMRELSQVVPGLAVAVTKRSCGMYAADQLSRAHSEQVLRAAVAEGLARAAGAQPQRLEGPVQLELDLHNRYLAELLDYLPGLERTAAGSVRCEVQDILGAVQVIGALVHLRADGY